MLQIVASDQICDWGLAVLHPLPPPLPPPPRSQDRTAHRHPPCTGALLVTLAAAQTCRQQLLQAVPSASSVEEWIDVATPAEACTKQLDGFDGLYSLVFSDEFNTGDRNFR